MLCYRNTFPDGLANQDRHLYKAVLELKYIYGNR